MRKIIILIVAALLVLILFSGVRAASIQKSIIPADAKWVIHFDMKKFSSTRLHELIMNDEDTINIRRDVSRFFKLYKFDPLKDIANITIFGKGIEEEDTVLSVEGNFDKEYLLSLIEMEKNYREIPYGKYTIYSWGHDDFAVFVSDNLILFSDNQEEILKNTLDVISGKKENITSSPLITYIKEIPPDAFITGVAEDISSLTEHHSKAVILKKMGMASLAIMEKKENLSLNLNFTTESSQDAIQIEQIIRGLIAFANMQLDETMVGVKLPEDIQISIDGNKVRIGITYPVEKLIAILTGRIDFLPLILLGEL